MLKPRLVPPRFASPKLDQIFLGSRSCVFPDRSDVFNSQKPLTVFDSLSSGFSPPRFGCAISTEELWVTSKCDSRQTGLSSSYVLCLPNNMKDITHACLSHIDCRGGCLAMGWNVTFASRAMVSACMQLLNQEVISLKALHTHDYVDKVVC